MARYDDAAVERLLRFLEECFESGEVPPRSWAELEALAQAVEHPIVRPKD